MTDKKEPRFPPYEKMYPPETSQERKDTPVYSGFVRYFPAAMMLVSRLSKFGNDKHNPGQPMHHARGKSMDHGDCIIRHQMDVGKIDSDSQLDHAVEVAWRAMAQLQELAEKQYGWPLAPGAKEPVNVTLTITRAAPTLFDFQDGNGPVAAHKHSNGGGWVADTAKVEATAYVGENAWVFGNAQVFGDAQVYGNAQVFGNAWVYDAQVYGNAHVYGNAWVYDAQVYGNAHVYGNARVFENAGVYGDEKIKEGYHV